MTRFKGNIPCSATLYHLTVDFFVRRMIVLAFLFLSVTTSLRGQCDPHVTASSATTFCQGGSVILISSPGSIYLWSTGESTQSITVNSSGSYSVTVTDENGCSATSNATDVTVNPSPIVNISPGGPTTFCQGGSVVLTSSAGTSYLWNTGATIQSITVSTSGSYSVTMTDANGCSATSTLTTVAVNNVTPGTVSSDQTICNGGDPAAFTSTTPGTGSGAITYRWESSVSPFSTWSIIAGATAETYDAPSGLTTTTEYRRIAISTINGVACESVPSGFVTVTVQSLPTAGVIAGNQTICNGGDPAAFTSTASGTGSGAITYRWESSVSPFSTWTTIAGVTTATYNVPSGLTTTTEYRRITISTVNGVACESVPATFITVTVQSIPTAGVIAVNQTICNGGDPASFIETVAATGDGTLTYQWQSNTSGCGGTFSNIPGAITSTYDPPALAITTYFRRIVTSTLMGTSCSVISNCLTVTVNPLPNVASITGPTSVCVGSAITLTNSSPGGVWSGSNNAIATINSSGVVTGVSGGSVVINYTVTNANGCIRTVSTTITVNSTIVTITPTGPTTFCRGNSVILIASGASTYTWSPGDGLSITTGSTVIATPEVTTTYLVTGTGVTGCTSTAQVTVTVNQRPEGIMSSDPAVCSGNNSGTVNLTITDGSTVIGWESSTNGGTSWSTYSPTVDQYTTTYENLTQTTVYRALLQLNGCQGYSSIGIIPVNNVLEPLVTVSATVSCLNTAVLLHASGYGQPPFPVEDFQNANPAGWSGDDAGANNGDPNSNWALTNNGKTFNGRLYNSQAPPTNSKFFIVTGITDEADHNATMTAPPFSLVGTINPILSFYTALNFNAGTTGIVEISTDGGITYTSLITYAGPSALGNPDNGWVNITYSLVPYINQPDVRIRFNYKGTAGSNWGLDNIGIISTFQPIAYHWSPLEHMSPSTGDTPDVTIIPDVGPHQYCVSSTTAAGCESDTVCVTINVLPLPDCNIIGTDGPVCPSSVNSFTAPAGMRRYVWTITGNGNITTGGSAQTVMVGSGINCNSSFTLTLSITDLNGCSSSCSKTITVLDNTAPAITIPAGNLSVNCDGTGNTTDLNNWLNQHGGATATDNCSAVTWSNNFASFSDLCGATGSTNVSFRATDACGNFSETSATLTIIDNTPPVITMPAGTLTLACFDAASVSAWTSTASALDICSGATVVTATYTAPPNNCNQTVTVTFSSTDACGNTASATKDFIVNDNIAPSINCPSNQIVDAFSGTSYIQTGNSWDATATDNCGMPSLTFVLTGATALNGTSTLNNLTFNEGVTTVTWTATDNCGNRTSCSFTVTVNASADLAITKTSNPVQAIAGQILTYTITVTNQGPSVARNVEITDNITTLVSPAYSTDGINYSAWVGTYTQPSLAAGNNLVLYLRGTLSINQCLEISNTASVTNSVRDDILTNNTVTIFTLVLDQTAPVITSCPVARSISGCSLADITGPAYSAVQTASSYPEFSNALNQGVASDNCTIASVFYQDVSTGTCPITVQRTWTIRDASGNETSCIQSITITDNTAPVITNCPQDLIFCETPGNTYTIPSTIGATDNCNGIISITYQVTGATIRNGSGNASGTFNTGISTITWNVTDACDNTSTCTTTITINPSPVTSPIFHR